MSDLQQGAKFLMDQRLKLLLVDDDDLILQSIRMTLPKEWRLLTASSLREIPKESIDAAFVDMHLKAGSPRADGLDVVSHLHAIDPHLEIVAISGDLDRELMEECLKRGASRFLAKPLSPEEVLLTLEKIEALALLRTASQRGKRGNAVWIGKSPASVEIGKQIAALRSESGPILLEGESGTGKEVAALLIHQQENLRPFISLNVAAMPENVFESEMFGHVRGAFTGAEQNKMGLAEAAHNGDLFLDEIEALPLTLQAKLLRFLESGEVRRVGAKDAIKVQVRVIAATNQNLQSMVREGRFREDLYWRLNGKKILLAPLRERAADIPELAEHFLAQDRPRRNKSLSDEAKAILSAYPFPGNVRELKRLCEQLSLHSPLPIIRGSDVSKILPGIANTSGSAGPVDLSQGLTDLLASYEADLIRQGLATGKEIDEVAALLKISRSSLYKKIKDYDIELRS
jgi:DNA-binding NtrC family response regulator